MFFIKILTLLTICATFTFIYKGELSNSLWAIGATFVNLSILLK